MSNVRPFSFEDIFSIVSDALLLFVICRIDEVVINDYLSLGEHRALLKRFDLSMRDMADHCQQSSLLTFTVPNIIQILL